MSDYFDINNEELLKDFFSEATQQVEVLESNILVIEQNPQDYSAVDEIFRAAHTLKGGSATVEMMELSSFTHAMEDLLDQVRSKVVPITEDVVDLLLKAIDIIKAMLESRTNGVPYGEDVSDMVAKLRSYVPDKKGGAKKAPTPKVQAPPPPKEEPQAEVSVASVDAVDVGKYFSEYEFLELKEAVKGSKLYTVLVTFDENYPMNTVGGIQVFASLKQCGNVLKTVPDFDSLYEDIFHEKVLYFVGSSKSLDEVKDSASINEVTLKVEVAEPSLSDMAEKAEKTTAYEEPKKEVSSQKKEETVGTTQKEDVSQATASSKVPSKAPTPGATSSSHAPSAVLRVDAKRIDYLLNLVSETVITKASLNQSAIEFSDLYNNFQGASSDYKDKIRKLLDKMPSYLEKIKNGHNINEIKQEIGQEYASLFEIFTDFDSKMKHSVTKFKSSAQNLGRIAGELQEGVMKIRMVPISQIFSRFPRVVRDLSKDLHKNIQLVIEGEDTELDKSVVEDLLDPIMHCVRNALDHGIETPEVRKAAGKPEQGIMLLKASNEGNMIVIEVSDDGHGIDVEKVKAKAVEKGLLHPGKKLTDVEAFQLVFAPGFSTSDKISNVSGRGVGLDVVKTHIEKLNGTVTVESEMNVGTRFIIKLPLTLAIIQGLLVRVGEQVYSIPITSVIESHRVKGEEIRCIDNYEVFNVREEVNSLLRLNRLFGIASNDTDEDGYNYIVIVGTEDKKVGLMVDSLIGEEDVVIKPLKDQFTSSPGIAGASILGDGSVSLIIDVGQLLELGLKQEIQARERREASIW